MEKIHPHIKTLFGMDSSHVLRSRFGAINNMNLIFSRIKDNIISMFFSFLWGLLLLFICPPFEEKNDRMSVTILGGFKNKKCWKFCF
jgi:hypothetical protein